MTGKLLVIDDDAGNRRLVKAIFDRQGFEVLAARDGRTGLEMAAAVPARRRPARFAHARARRLRSARAVQNQPARNAGRDSHRLAGCQGCGPRHAARRLQLPDQAGESRRDRGRRAARARNARAPARSPGASPARRQGRQRRPRVADGLERSDHPRDRAGRHRRRFEFHGARVRRNRNRQGARRACDSPAERSPPAAVCRARLRGDSRAAARIGAVRTREGRVYRRRAPHAKAASGWPRAARAFSTRSAISR